MSFIYAERMLEFAIRIGTDDIMKDETLVDLIFFTDKHKGEGKDLTPPGASEPVREPLPWDHFQKRMAEIPRRKTETGRQGDDIFENTIPDVPDIKEYLSTANIRIMHGFPRESKDLPAISITLGNEDETGQEYLGKQKQVLQSDTARYEVYGADFSAQYNIQIMTPNYDETIIWHKIIKYSLLRYAYALEGYGLRTLKQSWLDPELDPRWADSGLFIYNRSCIVQCVKDEDVPVKVELYKEFAMGVGTTDPNNQPDNGGADGTVNPDPAGPPPEPIDPRNLIGGQ